jgi:hypothetical protein
MKVIRRLQRLRRMAGQSKNEQSFHNQKRQEQHQYYIPTTMNTSRRNGYNGNQAVVYINNSPSWQERWVPTNWTNAQIKDFTVILHGFLQQIHG